MGHRTHEDYVELAPAGIIDVHNDKGDRLIALNFGEGTITVQPRSTTPSEKVYTGALPHADYTVGALFHYHGDQPAEKTISTTVERDVIPLVVPDATEFRRAQVEVPSEGLPIWLMAVWALVGGVLGIIASLFVAAVVWRLAGMHKR